MDYYDYENTPLGRDVFVVSEKYYFDFVKNWRFYLDDEDPYTMHPNWMIKNMIRGSVIKVEPSYVVVEVFLNTTFRFHSAVVTLPKADFLHCLENYNYQKQPILIVSEDWLRKVMSSHYSVFCMVDAIGIKKAILTNGGVEPHLFRTFTRTIDSLARKYRNYTFLSFGDSVIIKGTFCPDRKYYLTYKPEELVKISNEVRKLFRDILNCGSYAIFSQGLLYDFENKGIRKASLGKHYSLGSLGAPFAEIFEIDEVARSNIKMEVHSPCDLYMTTHFFNTLDVIYDEKGNFNKFSYESKMSFLGIGEYYAVGYDYLLSNLKSEGVDRRSKILRFRINYWIKDLYRRRTHKKKMESLYKGKENDLAEMIHQGPVNETFD